MSSFRRVLALVVVLFACATQCFAQRALPALTGHVTDEIGLLPAESRAALETQLKDFEGTKGSQVVVVIVDSTAPEAIEQFSIRLAQAWKIGRKGTDDGAILIVAKGDRKVRIEVGYGLEGAIPDATAKQIISDLITPSFKAGDFNTGIQLGVQAILARISGEPLPLPHSQGNQVGGTFLLILVIFIVIFIIFASAMQNAQYGYSPRSRSGGIWTGGGGGGFGGGGGGFSGGGGSFGGGGASGGW